MGGLNAENIPAGPHYDGMNIALELQQLDDLTIAPIRPPVKTILRNELHPLREQMEAYVAAKDQAANDPAEIKREFFDLEREKATVDAQLEKIKEKDTRVVDGLLFERGSHAGGKSSSVCPI